MLITEAEAKNESIGLEGKFKIQLRHHVCMYVSFPLHSVMLNSLYCIH